MQKGVPLLTGCMSRRERAHWECPKRWKGGCTVCAENWFWVILLHSRSVCVCVLLTGFLRREKMESKRAEFLVCGRGIVNMELSHAFHRCPAYWTVARDWGKCYALASRVDVCLHEHIVKGGLYGHGEKRVTVCACARCAPRALPETGVHGVRSRPLRSRAVLIFPQLYRALQTVESVKRMRVGSSFVLALSREGNQTVRVPCGSAQRATCVRFFFCAPKDVVFGVVHPGKSLRIFLGKTHAMDFPRWLCLHVVVWKLCSRYRSILWCKIDSFWRSYRLKWIVVQKYYGTIRPNPERVWEWKWHDCGIPPWPRRNLQTTRKKRKEGENKIDKSDRFPRARTSLGQMTACEGSSWKLLVIWNRSRVSPGQNRSSRERGTKPAAVAPAAASTVNFSSFWCALISFP